MNRQLQKVVSLFILGLSLAFTPLSVFGAPPETEAPPNEIAACLPSSIRTLYVIGPVPADGTKYYLVRGEFSLKVGAPLLWGHFLIGTDKSGCALLNAPADASTLLQRGLSAYVSRDIARKIALARWEDELRKYPDKASLEREVRAGLDEGPDRTLLSPEDVWALQQLGIDVTDASKGGTSP